jgi:hypothetical protein
MNTKEYEDTVSQVQIDDPISEKDNKPEEYKFGQPDNVNFSNDEYKEGGEDEDANKRTLENKFPLQSNSSESPQRPRNATNAPNSQSKPRALSKKGMRNDVQANLKTSKGRKTVLESRDKTAKNTPMNGNLMSQVDASSMESAVYQP